MAIFRCVISGLWLFKPLSESGLEDEWINRITAHTTVLNPVNP